MRRISCRSICSSMVDNRPQQILSGCHFLRRWLRRTVQQNEAPPSEFYCSLEEGCSRESCPASVRISAEIGISQRATCLVFDPAVLNRYAEHLRKLVFLLQWCSRDMQSTTWVLFSCCLAHFISHRAKSNTPCQSKICSARNPPSRGNPGLKRTWTDVILKKFD
jgi:hypothetical protein